MKKISNVMEIYESRDIYFTIGNFDGVHLGHRRFLNSIKKDCEDKNAIFLIITFIPHPSFILKDQKSFLLNTYDEKREILKETGANYVLELDFNRDFSTLSPGDFLEKYIFMNSNIKKMYLGHDFAFGANKSGDFHFVEEFCKKRNKDFSIQEEYKKNSDAISSSTIRRLLKEGEVHKASLLLGRDFFTSGRVIKGVGRGRQIGFPTANLSYDHVCLVPGNGVYITKTTLRGMTYFSVTNIGFNPTFNTGLDVHVETHILDFNVDIYGETIKVEYLTKLRNEKKFASVNELINQIGHDVKSVREFIRAHKF